MTKALLSFRIFAALAINWILLVLIAWELALMISWVWQAVI